MPTVKYRLLFFVCCIAALYSQRAEALSCSISNPWSTPTLNFGVTNTWSIQRQHRVRRSQNMTVECTDDAQYTGENVNVCLYIGDGSAGNGTQYEPRVLKNQSQYIHFQIYKDSNYSEVWGTFNNGPAHLTPRLIYLTLQSSWWNWWESEGSTNFTIYAETLRQAIHAGTTSYYWGANGLYRSNFTGNHTELRAKIGSPVAQCPSTVGEANSQGWVKGTFPFRVRARIRKQCEITSNTIADLNFGEVSNLSTTTAPTQTTNLNVQCTKFTPYRIGLNNGLRGNRTMKHSINNEYILYRLYQDNGYTQPWGNDLAGGSNTLNKTGSGTIRTHTIYGRVPTGQTPAAGSYSDRVTVTVQY